MEVVQDVVIVGAGISGLTTSLGLHRLGIRSLVLESSDSLRATGFAFTTWTNAWRALDAIGIGDYLRQQHETLLGNVVSSRISGLQTFEMSFKEKGKHGDHEIRCVKRKLLLESLALRNQFEENLGSSLASLYRKICHSRSGVIPCDDKNVYWYFTWSPSSQERELEKNPVQFKQYILTKLGKVPDEVRAVMENTVLDAFISSPLRYRHPWEILWGNISKGNVCVAGDALHPMTPDLGQGGCAALEDGVVLARCLGEALLKNRRQEIRNESEEGKDEYKRIEIGLNKYASERKWRSFDLISTAYVVGSIQEADGKIMTFLRDKFFSPILAGLLLKKADYDCGNLRSS
ncbi:hypothetical protein ACLB2K_016410 [Fragaria x ananassa]